MNTRTCLRILATAAIAVVALTGCNTMAKAPKFKAALLDPPTLQPGDTAVITVEVADKNRIIDRIEGVVKEDPRITFKLRDDGAPPDEKAGDGIWSLQVDVPFQAPPGDFEREFTAYRADGMAVPVRDAEGNAVPLTETLPVVIRVDDAPLGAAEAP